MSEGQAKWSEVSEEEANQYRGDPARRVAGPGAALVVVGCLGIEANLVLACVHPLRHAEPPVERQAGMNDETSKMYKLGQESAPLVELCVIWIPTLGLYSFVIAAGIKMRQLRRRKLVMAGTIIAMAPCSPVMLLGVPVGIWSLIVLSNPEVKAGFASNSFERVHVVRPGPGT
jgi:hypothetical protein